MGRLRDIFPGRSATRAHARAHRLLTAGSLAEAEAVASRGLKDHPGSTRLRELYLVIRRVATRTRQQDLRSAVVHRKDPDAFAELVELYADLGLHEEARRTAHGYAEAHPDDARAHRQLGQIELETYLATLDSRSGYEAHGHLVRAAELASGDLRTWLCLARLYWCVGARSRLRHAREKLEELAGEQDDVRRVLEATAADVEDTSHDAHEGLLERLEIAGRLAHDPEAWPLFRDTHVAAQVQGERAHRAVTSALKQGVAEEIAVLRANGTLLAHGSKEHGLTDDTTGLARAVQTLARTLTHRVGELDMGGLKRCTVEGPFGIVLMGRHHDELVAAYRPRPMEPLRLWERLAVALDRASVAVEAES
ncbi:MAG: tetratricopeptide repeat protein [Planctomycetota bacterium]